MSEGWGDTVSVVVYHESESEASEGGYEAVTMTGVPGGVFVTASDRDTKEEALRRLLEALRTFGFGGRMIVEDVTEPGRRESYEVHDVSSLARNPEPSRAKKLKAGVHGVPCGENMLARPDGGVRYFTVRESARLQTFPDDYVFHGSWTETMRQRGSCHSRTRRRLGHRGSSGRSPTSVER